ncbi:hypothetical protein [uncultured Roseobacter sp.]|uniref:hypothetical protein n=1 Tax=uncultured Roseobacter sp. TaxID=114847 RepID=UPI00261EEC03|nr:hypothetical protein [uncultured Roseobacter sp.]
MPDAALNLVFRTHLAKGRFVRAADIGTAYGYGSITRKLLPWGLLIIVFCYGLFIGSANVFSVLKAEPSPLGQRSDLFVYLDTAIEEKPAQALAVERWLRAPTVYVGDDGPRF